MSNEVLAHQFKLLRPLLDRAQEIQGVDPLTAYYTRMYAVQEGIKIPKRHPDISALIGKVMNEMEAAKPKLAIGGAETDRFHVEAFALKVFAGADKLDRAGRRDESTMKRYFAASQFFRVLEQFGPLDQQMENMRKYAAYRAVLIRKALKSGTECPAPPETTEVGSEELALEQELDAYALAGMPAAAATAAPPQAATAAVAAPPPPGSAPLHTQSSATGAHTPPPPPPPAAHLQPAPPPPPGMAAAAPRHAPGHAAPTGTPQPPSVSHGPTYPSMPPPPPPVLVGPPLGGPLPPGTSQVPPCIQQGCKVLFRAAPSAPIEQGTVIQVRADAATVALPDRLERNATASQLVPHVELRSSVLFKSADGNVQEAQVVAAHTDKWPPSFTVQFANGAEQTTDHTHFLGIRGPAAAPSISQNPSSESLSENPVQMTRLPSATSSTFTNAMEYPYPASSSNPGIYQGESSSGLPQPYAPPPPPPAPVPTYRAPAPASTTMPQPQHVAPAYHMPPSLPVAPPGFVPSQQAIMLATKKARECISSLNFQDIDSAVKSLHVALQALTTPSTT